MLVDQKVCPTTRQAAAMQPVSDTACDTPLAVHDQPVAQVVKRRSLRSRILKYIDPRQWVRTILHLDDSPHSIALGTAIGLFVGITPTGGIQMALVMFIAICTRWLFRFNRIAAILCVYVSNPLTTLPLFWYSYKIGTLFYPQTLTWQQFKLIITEHMFDNWLLSLKTLIVTVGMPLFLGSVILGAVVGVISYPVVYYLANRVQQRRHLAGGFGDKPQIQFDSLKRFLQEH